MATTTGTIKLRYVVTGANSGASEVSKNRWNDSLIVASGTNGDIFVRDSGQTDGWGWQTVLPVANGGTGAATLTSHGVLLGAGASAIAALAEAATGTVLTGVTGANPAFSASPALTSISLPSSTSITVVSASIKLTATSSFGVGAVSVGDWNVDNAGEFTPFSTNSRDVGSSALKVRSIYLGTSVITPAVTITSANGAAGTATKIQKTVTGIADAVPTTVLTITIPNAAHSATIVLTEVGSLGAGGAIGANEASSSKSYCIVVTRTPGVNAVATVSLAFGSAAAAVAGATTCGASIAAAAVSGAVGATNTIDLQVTVARGGGASDNHTCLVLAEVLNANATGVTIA